MNKHNERSVSPTMSIKPLSQKKPQIEEELMLGAHKIVETTLGQVLSRGIKRISHVKKWNYWEQEKLQ